MTLRLDEATSAQLRDVALAEGRSQQHVVKQAIKEYVERSAEAKRKRREQWKQTMKLGCVCRPITPIPGVPCFDWDEPPGPDPADRYPMLDPAYVQLAIRPLRHPDVLLPSPPGGILAYLDREDRVEI